ncbi:AMP-dependent synthetase/ligase [Pirellulales bacterium]|nr:AMP-dependent synthetase/ligase [Pirellulales bacterium]
MDSAAQTGSIFDIFAATVARHPEQTALGAIVDGELRWLTWREVLEQAERFAAALQHYGAVCGSHVAQVGGNSVEWILTDLAIHRLGAVHVPLHAALSPAQAAAQIKHAEARLVIVDSRLASAGELAQQHSVPTATHAELRGQTDAARTGAAAPPSRSDLATILYTSGTTGEPLGVMLTHDNLTSNAAAVAEAVEPLDDETRLCILPLSHIYARTCDLYVWLYRGTRLVLAESRETIFRDCQIARPNAMNAVPYFYRKVVHALHEKGVDGESGSLQQALGGEIVRCFCGGAALAPEIEAFYQERGLTIYSGYGLTESSPVISASSPSAHRAGCVGPPLPNTEVRLADDGEITARGPGVTPGYWHNEEATRSVIRDGWLYTGDVGAWEDGKLRIIGRKKEIIVLATGKNVAPAWIESLLSASQWVEQVCVVGDQRDYLTALVVPNPAAVRREIQDRKLWVWSKRRAVRHPVIRAAFRSEFDRLLDESAAHEKIGAFTLLPRAFSAEAGELTLKMSLCRKTIHTNFSREIERLYDSQESRRQRSTVERS